MNDIPSTTKSITLDIETIIQLSAVLLQLVGLFLVKPDIFNVTQNGVGFLAGNYANYLMLIVSIVFIYLSITIKKKDQSKYWLIICLITCCLFCFSYYKYNKLLNEKTTLLQATGDINPIRIIKGDNFLPSIQNCANSLKTVDGVIKDLDVIQNCADVKTPSEIEKIWPLKEIHDNRDTLIFYYSLCLMLGCISIVTGIQAIKCKRAIE